MRTGIIALFVVAVVAPGCRGRCCAPPPAPTPSAAFFHDGQTGDIRGGRPENVFPAPATRTLFFDVRDLSGARSADVAAAPAAPAAPASEPTPAAGPAPEWARLPELRALAPHSDLEMKAGVLIARGPAPELDAVRRRLDALRAEVAPK
ncbi:MAG: hypothetical protein U1E39_07285 [Planctomycetota bacterium]